MQFPPLHAMLPYNACTYNKWLEFTNISFRYLYQKLCTIIISALATDIPMVSVQCRNACGIECLTVILSSSSFCGLHFHFSIHQTIACNFTFN